MKLTSGSQHYFVLPFFAILQLLLLVLILKPVAWIELVIKSELLAVEPELFVELELVAGIVELELVAGIVEGELLLGVELGTEAVESEFVVG